MDTSCGWVHTSFGSSHLPGNSLTIRDWRFEDLQGRPYTVDSGVMDQPVVGKMAWTQGSNESGRIKGRVAPFYFPEGNAAGVNVYVIN